MSKTFTISKNREDMLAWHGVLLRTLTVIVCSLLVGFCLLGGTPQNACASVPSLLPAPASATLQNVPAGQKESTAQPYSITGALYSVTREEGEGLLAVLTFTPSAAYHVYAHHAGDGGMPLTLTAQAGGRELGALYPAGKAQADAFDATLTVNVYTRATHLYVPISPALAHDDATGVLVWSLSGLLCSAQNCWPLEAEGVLPLRDKNGNLLISARAESQDWWQKFARLEENAKAAQWAKAQQENEAAASNILRDEYSKQAVGGAQALGMITETAPQGAKSFESEFSAALQFAPRYFLPALEVTSLGKALLLGLLAGLILNCMPCVLPVIGLKLAALVSSAAQNGAERTRHFRTHTLFFSLGILSFFCVLAALLSSLGAAWGALFQNIWVIIGLVLITFLLGLSLFGVFSLPVLDIRFSGANAEKQRGSSPRVQAFATGVLTTLLATPCSGPLLGGVLGWAFLQTPLVLATVFCAVGAGMALPYVLLAAFPTLLRFFPKAGAWTGVLEQLLGFFLLATSLYLISILPQMLWAKMAVLLWLCGVLAWLWGRFAGFNASRTQRILVRLLCILCLAGALWWVQKPAAQPVAWQTFSVENFTKNVGKRPLLVDFTADWCPNCKVLEKTTLSSQTLRALAQAYGLVLIQVDMTEKNPAGEALLHALGSHSIPVVAIFPAGAEQKKPLVLRDIFSAKQLKEALHDALGAP